MIRAIRPQAMALDDAAMVRGWNISPNLAYTLLLLPGASSCGVLLYDEDGSTLIATGAALVGTAQPCVLIPQTGQTIGAVDADLGWHLLLTTTGTESQRTIRLGPAIDLPDEIHPVYGDDDMSLARATAAINEAAHYVDDIAVTCPLGLGAGLGDVVSVPVDGAAMVGQVESITWTATPDGVTEQSVIRRHVAIAPEAFVEPTPITPPTVADDTGETAADETTSGNVLTNDEAGLTIVAVNGLSASVGAAVAGNNGGSFTIASNGAWTFDPDGDFALLTGAETADTSVTYYASDGVSEASANLTITVSAVAGATQWTPAEITSAQWIDFNDDTKRTIDAGVFSQASDKSGNNRNATASSTSRPTLFTDSNGMDWAAFDGVDDFMSISVPMVNGSSIFMALDTTELQSGARAVFDRSVWGAPYPPAPYLGRESGYDYRPSIFWGTNWAGSMAAAFKTQGVLQYRFGQGSIGMRLNGGTEASVNTSQTVVSTWATLNTNNTQRSKCKVGEYLIVNSVVDSATREKIEGYLAHKWGLATSLPFDHPYKSAAPTL